MFIVVDRVGSSYSNALLLLNPYIFSYQLLNVLRTSSNNMSTSERTQYQPINGSKQTPTGEQLSAKYSRLLAITIVAITAVVGIWGYLNFSHCSERNLYLEETIEERVDRILSKTPLIGMFHEQHLGT